MTLEYLRILKAANVEHVLVDEQPGLECASER